MPIDVPGIGSDEATGPAAAGAMAGASVPGVGGSAIVGAVAGIVYDVYANDGAGGPVDYGTPVAASLGVTTWTGPPLAVGSDTTFAVRARGPSGLRETNVDARVRIVLDAMGRDVSAILPRAPVMLGGTALGGGRARAWWRAPRPRSDRQLPTEFRVYLTPLSAGAPDWSAPVAVVSAVAAAFAFGQDYTVDVPGMTGAGDYWIGVRAANLRNPSLPAIEGNTVVAIVAAAPGFAGGSGPLAAV